MDTIDDHLQQARGELRCALDKLKRQLQQDGRLAALERKKFLKSTELALDYAQKLKAMLN